MEHFLQGLAWLRARDEVDSRRVFVQGTSRGSEAALLTGLYADPPPAGVIAVMPSHVLWAGLDFSRGFPLPPAWRYQGRDLPYASWGWSWEFLHMMAGHPVRLRPLFEAALRKGVPAEAHIPVEQMRSSLLLISGTDDQVWPSTAMAEALLQRARQHHVPFEVTHLALQGAGHAIAPYPTPPVRLIPPFLAGGVTREANVDGGQRAWEARLAFVLDTPGP